MAVTYAPSEIEKKWYTFWEKEGCFSSVPDEREAYTIVIPPPNVTGILHMGHMLNNTIQDVLVRRARMKGYNACWVPGTDHASIATEAKVVAKLKESGIDKNSLSREEFLSHAWDWTHEHGGIILKQLRRLGASCDWNRTKFTMDADLSASVIKVFIDLYNKGLIYRGYRMVNWDPEAKTTVSDEEVIHEERQGKLYYLSYSIVGSKEKLTVATTRPETILGDTAVCVHPEDDRYSHLVGKKVIVPISGREIPIISDTYVDREFGTGSLKITPAHDINDKEIGERHNLEVIDIFNEDATLNNNGLHYEGKDRFEVRKLIEKELQEKGFMVKVEPHTHKVGTSERTKAVIEPRISKQWFLKMEEISKPALQDVLDGDVKLIPNKFINTYKHWMENVRDWNISRQLWWGHQIPAFFYKEEVVVAETKVEALEILKKKLNDDSITIDQLTQDPDVLDTWFSSWLWPMSVFDGISNPDNEEFTYYYPTQDLVTAPEILFFWVARMIIAGHEFAGKKPFSNVYLTGIVRDKQGRKMSKSLGNSPDPIALIDKHGADGVRVGMLLCSPAGNDLPFDESLCEQGRNFSNKIWNAYRLVSSWEIDESIAQPEHSKKAISWFDARISEVIHQIEGQYEKYRLSDVLMQLYKLVWDDFCSWYLEIIKPSYQCPIDKETQRHTVEFFDKCLRLLHPFMPFITEELWQQLPLNKESKTIMYATYPEATHSDKESLQAFTYIQDVVSSLRTFRKEKNLPMKQPMDVSIKVNTPYDTSLDTVVEKLLNTSKIEHVNNTVEGAFSMVVGNNEIFVPISEEIDVESEKEKISKELDYTKGFLTSVSKKLSNDRFVNNAPEQVVAAEQKKRDDAEAKIKVLEGQLANFS